MNLQRWLFLLNEQTQKYLFDFLCEAQSKNLLLENEGDEGIDVGDADFAVAVDVGGGGAGSAREDDVDDGIDIGDVDLAIGVHVTGEALRDVRNM